MTCNVPLVWAWLGRRTKEVVKEEVERMFTSQCTFRPSTVEGAKREAIQRLLNEESAGE